MFWETNLYFVVIPVNWDIKVNYKEKESYIENKLIWNKDSEMSQREHEN